ncbi:MAG: hypothetical protein WC346_10085 [Methanogenium sp.]|jgi:hypothetical protein
MWRKVLSWEEEEAPINYFEKMDDDVLIKEFNDFDQLIDIVGTFGIQDLRYRQKISEEMERRNISPDDPRIWTNRIPKALARNLIQRRQRTAAQRLTLENITRKQIEPGDVVIAPQTYKDNTGQEIFTAGKEYTVLDYFEANQTVGLKVQCNAGPWTITFRSPDGIASTFTWRQRTEEEKQFAEFETNPFATDILNALSVSGRFPMTVDQVTDQVQREYMSEGGYGHLTPVEFKALIGKAWGILFHLGYVGMVQGSDKVNITPEGRKYLAS